MRWRLYLFSLVAAAQTPMRFENKAAEAGVNFVLENSPTPKKHLVETMPGGLAMFDYNSDGRLDIFFSNGAALPSLEKSAAKFHNRLFRNDGNWKFSDVTREAGLAGAGYSMGAAAADFDNDGHPDLFVAGVYRNLLYRNRGDGATSDQPFHLANTGIYLCKPRIAHASGVASDRALVMSGRQLPSLLQCGA